MAHQQPGVCDLQRSSLDRFLGRLTEAFQHEIGVMLHLLQDIGVGVAFEHMIQDVAVSTGVETNVDGAGSTEQIVQIAHDLLVGPTKKESDPVGLILPEWMEL